MNQKKVLVIGATGLVGGQLVSRLSTDDSISDIICLVRRVPPEIFKKVSYQLVNFMDLDKQQHLFDNVDHVFCCIGTWDQVGI